MPNFDSKIFMFPESYNQLRIELETHWNPRKTGEHPHHKLAEVRWHFWQCGWAMAWEAETFVQYMQEKLGAPLKIIPNTRDDGLRVDVFCKAFLTELRKRRGEPNP